MLGETTQRGDMAALHQQSREDDEESLVQRDESTEESSNPSKIPVHADRWRVLFSFAVLSMSSAWIWITWSPIVRPAAAFWNVPLGHVDALAGIYLYVYVPCSFLSLYLVVNCLGLYNGLLVGAVFNVTGAVIRWACLRSYQMVYIGTLLCAVAQTFTLSTPPLIAARWFGNSERATATGLGVLANQLGTAVGLGATIVVDFAATDDKTSSFLLDESKLRTYLGLQAVVAMTAIVLISVFGSEEPPATQDGGVETHQTEPTQTEQSLLVTSQSPQEKNNRLNNRPKYIESVGRVFSSPNNIAYMLSFGMAVGVFYTIPAFISQMTPLSWSPRSNGWLGVFYQVVGAYASFQTGRIVDASQQHRRVCLTLLSVASFSLVALLFTQTLLKTETWEKDAVVFILISLVGSSLASWNSVGLELGTGICHPANEAAVGGVLEAAAELFGFLWVLLGGQLIETPIMFLALLAGVISVAGMILSNLDTRMKRPL
ncbi:MFS transporter, FLVCR family, feline leukemia virus subgroup C receptor-related protein [Fistulifera solaris]|jgi:hypothetical protein|uniref:MFS transporter, FLVCR family, feline leukemia virus subgroup C receptor-related protein n=1 Tax=Fistulifera solaris TaxID=1519565 RepID=A0A1Z5KIR7_FISSO|nr:MFS transporter, FLVCR family, feline leukemia virus subgroup C receptor-related protein [Fistulifera solaris]|eukprot:GAX26025.1 MFS transporter, FLVCR family, feline leukemia virus subgroup C receptor-related protein [Fistulifera solaris]